MAMGFYGSVFFKSWLVEALDVEAFREKQPKISMIVKAVDAEDACDKMRTYLTDEGFQFGAIKALLG
jgi:hypothetical protein